MAETANFGLEPNTPFPFPQNPMAVNRFAFCILFVCLVFAQTLNAQGDAQTSLIVGTWQLSQFLTDGKDIITEMQTQVEESIAARTADPDMPQAERIRIAEETREQMEMAKRLMLEMRFEFNSDGTFRVHNGIENNGGTWLLTNNNTRLKTRNNEGIEEVLVVAELTDTILRLSQTRDGQQGEMILRRVQ